MIQHIVVWDPRGKVNEGSLIQGEGYAAELQRAGVVTLPVDPEFFSRNPVAGFASRHWGPGWPYTGRRSTVGCAMLLYVTPAAKWVHWVARARALDEEAREGMLRLTNLGGMAATVGGGLSATSQAIDLSSLTDENRTEDGEWILRGQVQLHLTTEAYVAMAIQGAGAGIRILQSAVSLTP